MERNTKGLPHQQLLISSRVDGEQIHLMCEVSGKVRKIEEGHKANGIRVMAFLEFWSLLPGYDSGISHFSQLHIISHFNIIFQSQTGKFHFDHAINQTCDK